MINLPPDRLGPTVRLIKPKGRDRAGYTVWYRETDRERKKLLLLSLLLSGCHQSTGHDSSSWLPALVSHLSPLLPSTFIFSQWWENFLVASLSLLLFFLSLWSLYLWLCPEIEGASIPLTWSKFYLKNTILPFSRSYFHFLPVCPLSSFFSLFILSHTGH